MRRSSSLLLVVLAALIVIPANAQEPEEGEGSAPAFELSEEARRALRPESQVIVDAFDPTLWSEAEEEPAPADENPTYTPISLPGGETRTSANPQAISLPSGEGSIEGMGESFSPILSSGTATFTVPISVAPGRAGVQPSLSLSYSSSGGNGPVGFGWGVGAPFISRQTDRGLPLYDDRPAWHAGEDRFIYNGGQELVPVSSSAMAIVDQQAAGTSGTASTLPSDVIGWQQYRARVEGGFMRFFRAPSSSQWVVQSPDGTRFDFGRLPAGTHASDLDTSGALEIDDEDGTRIFRWMLTRSSDSHGSTIYYSYSRDRGQLYLTTIHYISPASCGAGTSVAARRQCDAALSQYGARLNLVYEPRDDAFTTYTSGFPITTARRIRRIEVTAYDDAAASRTLVRRYHLRYDPTSFHSVLSSVQVEGRPQTTDSMYDYDVGHRSVREGGLTDAIVGATLPPMRFGYTRLPTGTGAIPGFGALSSRVRLVRGSPPHSIDEGRAELMDVNSDGLVDLVVTAPSLYPTATGAPASGVFFNGFSGADARPGAPAEFSGAVPVPVRSELASALTFTNANIVPMDIDGDGRSDLLHMPRARTYGWFTPTRRADPTTGNGGVSPAQQGWRFSYAEVQLPPGDLDPRIDFGRDGQHVQAIDVNNDHLIDVVRTSGTVMQTWLNLGWLPGGDGRFGSFARDSDGDAVLSTQPYESCVLQSGFPVDFESPEVRFADMNGDGLQDIVEIQPGRVRWWPGRGIASWGAGPIDCARGQGANRYLEMQDPPRVGLAIDLAGVQLADVDGDGASDVVQVRFDAIDVWFNRAGQGFAARHIIRGTPATPSFTNRVRLIDIDGSGTLDAVYGEGGRWSYVDLLSPSASAPSLRPRLLVSVENGLGALTTMDYGSAATDYLADLAEAASCASCESFRWGKVSGSSSQRLRDASNDPNDALYRPGGTPVLSTVVRRVRTSDRFSALGRGDQVSESVFAYHDGYYEGIEQEFRGFGAADSTVIGDDASQSVHTRTWFHQGRRAQSIADDRLAHNPDEALKGREFLTEVFDTSLQFLSTTHASLTTRTLATGLDGTPIQYAFVSETNELRYDTTPFEATQEPLALPSVSRESVSGTGAVVVDGADAARTITMRGARRVRVRTTYDSVDNRGQVLQQTAWGHVFVAGSMANTDPQIVQHNTPRLINGAGQWIWRTQRSYVTGSEAPGLLLGDTTTEHDTDDGDAQSTLTNVEIPLLGVEGSFLFGPDPAGEGGAFELEHTAQDLEATTFHDVWGNPTVSCAGDTLSGAAPSSPTATDCLRFTSISYDQDDDYQQFPTSETVWVAPASGTYSQLVTNVPMDAAADPGWDRGLGALRRVRDPNGVESRAYQDGLGRPTAMVPPRVAGCSAGVPTTTIRYFLTGDPTSQPISRIETTSRLTAGCFSGDAVSTQVTVAYVDGLGRSRAQLAQGGDSMSAPWIRSGISRLDRRGQVVRTWQPAFFTGAVTDHSAIVAELGDAIPSTRAAYDAFGRARSTYAEDGAQTRTSFHASSADVCDPLDDSGLAPFAGTCTTSRSDGHGRVIDQILRQRMPSGPLELHRLWTWYRADGGVLSLVRALTSNQNPRADTVAAAQADASTLESVGRDFIYDSVGRRLSSRDPDTDDPLNTDPRSRSWRYLFNRVGDLVAVRDPRGCGQNFLYDLGGRLVGEQYVACAEAQTSIAEQPSTAPAAQAPAGSVSLTRIGGNVDVDVRYEYDVSPDWLASANVTFPLNAAGTLGRATGSRDRGQRSAVLYDERGNAIWSARQMALIPAYLLLPTGTFSGNYPVATETSPPSATVAYDQSHTYVSSTTFDHAGRARSSTLPRDPDHGGAGLIGPVVSGAMTYNRRGLPQTASVSIGSNTHTIVGAIMYDRDGAVTQVEYGGTDTTAVVTSMTTYDDRRRPTRMQSTRTRTPGSLFNSLGYVQNVFDQTLTWDAANNLTNIQDGRSADEWPAGHRPQSIAIDHDALYHVIGAEYSYTGAPTDTAYDWRSEALASNTVDPMHPDPAARIGALPDNRVMTLDYAWDWQGNQTWWDDDADAFHERSIGTIVNGRDLGARPSALYLSTNIPSSGGVAASWGGAGWVEVEYGVGGNVASYTVHGACQDAIEPSSCTSGASITPLADRIIHLRASCACIQEQHYQYDWDELNRMVEARRFDRSGGSGGWSLNARMRYRYDGANQRTVTETFTVPNAPARVMLYVLPGDFERRGVVRGASTYDAVTAGVDATETQYLIAGARLVWDATSTPAPMTDLDRNRRITIPISDMLQTTSAVVDLESDELIESSSYFPSGVREDLWTRNDVQPLPIEQAGFTGKDADEEVGTTYFGERWLLPHLGRWASADPLHVHMSGGGESLNTYHYVSGSLLQARDSVGLNTLFLGGAGYESETREYAEAIVERLRGEGAPKVRYLPISDGGQFGNIRRTLSLRGATSEQLRTTAASDRALLRATGQSQSETRATLAEEVVGEIRQASNADGGSRNIVGYSYGSVMAAHAALDIANSGEVVDNVFLIGTPIDPDSDLYRELTNHPNIRYVTRVDVAGDPFSGGIDPTALPEMERHFYFIDNDDGQQDWLASTIADQIDESTSDTSSVGGQTITVDPGSPPAADGAGDPAQEPDPAPREQGP